jgi:hypothetical protein
MIVLRSRKKFNYRTKLISKSTEVIESDCKRPLPIDKREDLCSRYKDRVFGFLEKVINSNPLFITVGYRSPVSQSQNLTNS